MEEYKQQSKSIWGSSWSSLRVWLYPLWLAYELSIRFYEYIQISWSPTNKILESALDSVVVIVCTIFLTIPSCMALYQYLRVDSSTDTSLSKRLKRIL